MKHPYSEILHAIADGKEIQYRYCSVDWHDVYHDRLLKLLAYDGQDKPNYKFRIKPATITINGVECDACTKHGSYYVTIRGSEVRQQDLRFETEAARDAAYAALIKPFGEQA